ncbi:hypothetical protein D3C76_1619560 [compost metagenome]
MHRVLIGICLPFPRFQRGMGQEGLQRHQILIFILVAVLARGRDQLLKVFDTRLALLALFLLIHDKQPGIADHPVGLHMQRHFGGFVGQ